MTGVEKIIVKDIKKSFSGKQVLNGVSLEIEKGKTVSFMGPSGCGKTTLIRILAGLETQDEGTVSGIDKSRISFVFQEDRLIQHASALTNCILPLKGKDARERGMKALYELGLSGEEKKSASKLSGGMARRVAIARAMLADAETVFLDEPFKGLDAENHENAIQFVKKYSEGKTLIMVTHNMEEAKKLSDIVYEFTPQGDIFSEKSEK